MVNCIVEVLKKRKWNQRRLAKASGLDPAHICKVIHNTADPRVGTALKIAAALGMKIEDLWKS